MKILAIETSGHTMSVALAENNTLVSELFRHAGLKHSEQLLPSIDRVLHEAGWVLRDIGKIAVTTGPGSFTGIRVGLSCARTLAHHLRVPLVGCTALDVLEVGVPAGGQGSVVIGLIDALREEVFVAHPGTREVRIESLESFCRRVSKMKSRVTLAGDAVITQHDFLVRKLPRATLSPDYFNYPRAGILALKAAVVKGTQYHRVEPLYIRRSWAEEKAPAISSAVKTAR
ncbi:MAG: tRNA (adenosine(37)-N6)-threonylcarbamoyltransferase complex dimerization subunit type 1 TsaB [Elusimicrobia bacterium]|nr:tRNA (adenosine(37)-N6)-threonylcarbamoyltransferase complex dimerization subunit type 1 TsaB [Elusimicrobiota bacterium]